MKRRALTVQERLVRRVQNDFRRTGNRSVVSLLVDDAAGETFATTDDLALLRKRGYLQSNGERLFATDKLLGAHC